MNGAFHGDAQLKADLLAEIRLHREQDRLVRGTYGKVDDPDFHGCGVGCAVHSLNRLRGLTIGCADHAGLAEAAGLPVWFLYLMDGLFESVPVARHQTVPEELIAAIPVGADLTLVFHRFLHWLLVDPEHGVIGYADATGRTAVQAVADLHERIIRGGTVTEEEWAAARVAAWAARDAARDAARAAARAAWDAAMDAAGDAAWAAGDAARDALWEAAALEKLIALLREAAVPGSPQVSVRDAHTL